MSYDTLQDRKYEAEEREKESDAPINRETLKDMTIKEHEKVQLLFDQPFNPTAHRPHQRG